MKLRVLLVEDNRLNSELARAVLELGGHQVEVAPSAEAFRAMLKTDLVPDIVLMDYLLPEANGIVLLKELRANARFARVPVVALTAHVLPSDIKRFLAEGFGGVLTKPIEVRRFAEEVERFANRKDL